MNRLSTVVAALAALTLACELDYPQRHPDPGTVVEKQVGVGGDTLALEGGPSLIVPMDALTSDVKLSISAAREAPPSELTPVTPLFAFGPPTTVFGRPSIVRFPVTGNLAQPTVYWSRRDGPGFEPIGGTVANGVIEAEVVHLGSGFVGQGRGTRTVSGTSTTTWVSDTRIENVPTDLTVAELRAMVEQPNGTFLDFPVTARADGTFTVDGVPHFGKLYLRYPDDRFAGTSFLVTSKSAIDLGFPRVGRADAVPTMAETVLTIEASNLAPWQANDSLQLFSMHAEHVWHLLEREPNATPPQPGETTASTPLYFYHLVDAARGDRVTVTQLSGSTSDTGVPYSGLRRALTYSPFTMTDGVSSTISGEMTEPANLNPISLDWRITEYLNGSKAANPGTCASTLQTLIVTGHPGGLSRGFYSSTPDFLVVDPVTPADLRTGKMLYGMPSGTWGTSVYAAVGCHFEYLLDGTTRPVRATSAVTTMDPVDVAQAAPLAPRQTPVRNVRVNGQPAMAGVAGVTSQPLVSWEPPVGGPADLYTVVVTRLFVNGSSTSRSQVGRVHTNDLQVRIPSELMVPGEKYFLTINAVKGDAVDAAAPGRSSLPTARASTLTWIISMAP